MMAAQRGWSIEETANKLLEVSARAQERARLRDEGYALITPENAVAADTRGWQKGRGSPRRFTLHSVAVGCRSKHERFYLRKSPPAIKPCFIACEAFKNPSQGLKPARTDATGQSAPRPPLDIAARADAEEGIRQDLEDAKKGKIRPAREFFDEFEAKHGIPR
jgi:hypothetical protein